MELSQWRKLFPEKILRRGQEYYEAGRVRALERQGDAVTAVVAGGGCYQVELKLTGQFIEEWSCVCPYGEDGTPCKHLAAVFLALERGEAVPRPSLEALVAGLSGERARRLLVRLAREDARARALLYAALEERPEGQDGGRR